MERLEQQLNFLLEMDKLKSVIRQTYLADGSRKEDDAEHSWHLAMMAFILAEYARINAIMARCHDGIYSGGVCQRADRRIKDNENGNAP